MEIACLENRIGINLVRSHAMLKDALLTALPLIGIFFIMKILEWWKKIKVSGLSALGMILILLHQVHVTEEKYWIIYGLLASVTGIFLLAIDITRIERKKVE